MRATNIHESEWDDCRAELRLRKRSLAEFEFSEHVEPIIGPGIQPMRGHVTIKNRNTGQERTYWTGNANAWVVEFIRDMDAAAL